VTQILQVKVLVQNGDVIMSQVLNIEPDVQQKKRKRPIILTIVCILLFLRVLLAANFLTLLFLGILNSDGLNLLSEVVGVTFALAEAGLAVLLLIAVIGLWLLRPWAWRLIMMIIGVLLVLDLWTHFTSASSLLGDLELLLNIMIVIYLVQNDVRELFVDARETIG
jgi:hypothetical protein